MEDLSFLGSEFSVSCGLNNAILNVMLQDGRVSHISDCIYPHRFLDNCPLLYHAFEHGQQNRLQASLEVSSRSAIICLLRYCYIGTYCVANADFEPILLLPHAETYKIAEDFDVPALQLLVHGTFSSQIELACSLPTPPQDLGETVRFLYLHFSSQRARQQQSLLSSLLNYCISSFQYHKLGTNAKFLAVTRDIPEFRQDLCLTSMERNFQDDCALDIIGLALEIVQPQPSVRPTTLASRDLPQEMLLDTPETSTDWIFNLAHDGYLTLERDCSSESVTSNTMSGTDGPPGSFASSSSTLVCRPKELQLVTGDPVDIESSSEDEGFSLVHRPKSQPCAAPDDLVSSPEIIPHPVDVLAVTGSDYPSDDEWTML